VSKTKRKKKRRTGEPRRPNTPWAGRRRQNRKELALFEPVETIPDDYNGKSPRVVAVLDGGFLPS